MRFEFVAAKRLSTLGGWPALEALTQQFRRWKKLRAVPGLDPRTRASHGCSPELIVAPLLYSFCSGGASLADAERLNDEPPARLFARVARFADQSQLGEWLRSQSDAPVAPARRGSSSRGCLRARRPTAGPTRPGRGSFADTPKSTARASKAQRRVNYNGDLALSWQTFWFGPFLADTARAARHICAGSIRRASRTGA